MGPTNEDSETTVSERPNEPVTAELEQVAEAAGKQPEAEAAASPYQPPPPDPRDLRIKFLEKKLAEQESTLHAYIKAHKKAEADFEATKARLERDKDRELGQARGKMVARLLDVSDNLERTVDATRQGGTREAFLAGLELVAKQFLERLGELGLVRVDPTGHPFDPASMEALGVVPVADPSLDNTVVNTLKAGFRLGDQEIRPALVQVGRLTS